MLHKLRHNLHQPDSTRPALAAGIEPRLLSNNGGQHQPVNSHGVSYAFDQIVIRRDHSQGLMIPVRNLVACYLLGTHKVFLSEKDRKSTRLNSSHVAISYAVFCLKKKITYSIPV